MMSGLYSTMYEKHNIFEVFGHFLLSSSSENDTVRSKT